MKQNFLCIATLLLFSFINSAFASEASLDKLQKHREWITGNLKIKYTLSNVKKGNSQNHNINTFESLVDVKKFAHSQPLIRSIKTTYDTSQKITKINGSFLFEFEGFDPINQQPQLFTVYRQICIDPIDASENKSNCVNTKDNVLVDDIQIINIVDINLEAYNLSPGKYIASTEMIIQQVDSDTAYLTDGDQTEFTVQHHQ